jgi:putative ABC transport system permease protein
MYTKFYRFPLLVYRLTPQVVFTAALVSAAVALAATVGAFRQAARLQPAEAMRPAPPAVYRPTVLERLGLQSLFAQPTRMILRQLERRPVRALLSCAGIATAVALLIASMFSLDALDFIIDVQFQYAAREDVSVTFAEPRPWAALDEISHMPGVLTAEPFRAVPVRLRSQHRVERLVLLGLPAEADLNRLIDADLQPVAVPDKGVMLSSKLAELLGVGRGDEIFAEVLEGRRPVRPLIIAGVVEEFIGTSAFMALPELNDMMQEGLTVSGARLLVDRSMTDTLYRRLKDTPAVASIGLREESIAVVRRTLAENMLRMIVFNALFAGLIAYGIVYNSARIALSERVHELASLRVLGFTRWEVSYVLLGELALLTLAALPVGCALGYALAWLITLGLDTELYRIPLVIGRSTYSFAVLTVIAAAALSALLVRRRLDRLDLVAVLKSRD